ncbi:MAG: GPR1/FUN34/YaaH family transporter [Jatrophihabitantaceae bacterium]
MATETTTPDSSYLDRPPIEPAPVAAAPNAFLAGNPAAVGLPVFIVGSVALALVLIGYVPASAAAASLPIIMAATGIGLAFSTVWAAAVGQSAVASIFGIFAGFWLSYATLVLGLTHNWFAITASAATHTQGLFLISWIVVVTLLTLGTLRLPMAFTLLFALVDLALLAVLIGTLNASTGWLKLGGVLVFAFAAVGAYLYVSVVSEATGGATYPAGRPLLAG